MAQLNTEIDFGKITLRKALVLQTVGTSVKYKVTEDYLKNTFFRKNVRAVSQQHNRCQFLTPPPKDKLVSFPLPEMTDAMDASKAASSVLTAVSEGELTPIEGTTCRGAYRQLQTHSGTN